MRSREDGEGSETAVDTLTHAARMKRFVGCLSLYMYSGMRPAMLITISAIWVPTDDARAC